MFSGSSPVRAEIDVFPFQVVIACALDSDALRDVLARKHGEAVVLQGTMSAGQVVEIWTSPDGASWTITATLSSGTICLLSGGDDLKTVPPAPADAPKERT